MKRKLTLPTKILNEYIKEAMEGYGREVEIGGGNTRTELTIFSGEGVPTELVDGTVRVYFNNKRHLVGHKILAPAKKRLDK